MSQIPFLVISDAVTSPTGLGRIGRELCIRIHLDLSDVFRLGTLGYGGNTSRVFPWQQYVLTNPDGWRIPELPRTWLDFAGKQPGIILFILNASWLSAIANPDLLPDGDLKSFWKSGLFQKWLYFPIDAAGPNGRLVASQGEIIRKFDRVVTYTSWAADLVSKTVEALPGMKSPFKLSCDHLPHGTDERVFFPRDRHEARQSFIKRIVRPTDEKERESVLTDDVTLIGVVGTNTERKYWPLAFEVCAELKRRGVMVGLWAHTDAVRKYWDLPVLANEFGLERQVIFTNGHLTGEDLAWGYAACDCTLGIAPEGWGLPLAESLACGVPCVTMDYAGATEFVPPQFRVKPISFKYNGFYLNRWPDFNLNDWVIKVRAAIGRETSLDPQFTWSGCWPKWAAWLKAGIR